MQPNLTMVLEQVGKDKGIDVKILLQTLEQAILTAAKKVFGLHRELEAQYNEEIGAVDLFQICYVVADGEGATPAQKGREITKTESVHHGLEAEIGDELLFQIFYRAEDSEKAREQEEKYGDLLDLKETIKQFGRIAAQTAKQVIIQRMREAERENVYNEFKDRKGELISGTVRRFERGNLIVEIGRNEAILPVREQVPRESYRSGDRITAYVVDVEKNARGPQIVLSRTHKGLLEKLFEQEVPEIYEKIVRIESSAREPGARAKIAVSSRDRDVDPVGACVGMKGSRVQAVVQELRGEKIDIVPYSEDPARFVCNAIAPAEVSRVVIDAETHTMELIVPDDKLSLAIGKKGQNVRLASQLTGWRIDIHSESKVRELEEHAKRSMAEMDGSSEELASTLFKLGWRSAEEVARGKIEELSGVPGVGGEVGAAKLKEAAARQVEVEKQRAREAAERAALLAAEAKKSDEQRLLSVRGVAENTLPSLYQGGYTSVEKLNQEEDIDKLAESTGIGVTKARQLKHSVKVYLGELDPSTPEPTDEQGGANA
jgi:transcription termination/antitermination protein NusA